MSAAAGNVPRRRPWIYASAFLALSGLLVWVFQAGFGTNPNRVPFGLEGKPAPPFTLRRLDTGEEVSLASFRGKPVVLNFWASWCGPCAREHPVIEWGHQRFGQQVQFLGLIFEDSEENARGFLAKHPSNFPQLVDPRSSTAVEYAVTGVPETYFVDAQGVIRGKHAAPIDPRTLNDRVQELLSPTAARGSP